MVLLFDISGLKKSKIWSEVVNILVGHPVSAETIQGRKLFKGGNYSQKYGKLNLLIS